MPVMTIQTIAQRDYRPQLRAVSRAMRDVHRSLIDFSRERYELVHGAVRTRGELLGLLLGDEAFAWLGPLSGLIAEIDDLAARDVAPNEADMEETRALVEALTSSSDDPNAFGSRYIALLASEPRVAMHHGELRAAVQALPGPPAA
jgi:hypothetical protein